MQEKTKKFHKITPLEATFITLNFDVRYFIKQSIFGSSKIFYSFIELAK